MGGGVYSSQLRAASGVTQVYASTTSTDQVFKQHTIHKDMDVAKITVRESCDSDEHPNSVAVMLGLDETGSMGKVPHELIKYGLPNLMDCVQAAGVADVQLCMVGIGDHMSDDYPLQLSQFESSHELIDYSLEKLYLEGNGGGNMGESYHLLWYAAAFLTKTDCWDKRQQKGVVVTIGDEYCLKELTSSALKRITGNGDVSSYTRESILVEAQKRYDVYHIHVNCGTYHGSNMSIPADWRRLLGDENVFIADSLDIIPQLIAKCILTTVGKVPEFGSMTQNDIDQMKQESEIL